MANNPLQQLVASGQSPWIDFIRRSFMADGSFARLIQAGEIRGATSNPTIFEKAIAAGNDYDAQLKELVQQGVTDPRQIFDELAIRDIQTAADNLRPVYDQADGADGFISLEVSPTAANNTEVTLKEARDYWRRVNRPNLMIKVPGTPAGMPAIEQLLTEGLNINITLLFAQDAHIQVMEAFLNALNKRVAQGLPIDKIASVASFFVSRVDTEVDKRLEALAASDPSKAAQAKALLGTAAIANAKMAYQNFQNIFNGNRFATLRSKGALAQRPLWASTSTKNPAYRDVIYVEQLIGPETVNTMPPATIDAFRDHGVVQETLTRNVAEAHEELRQLDALGISLADVTHKLLVDGVQSFTDSYNQLLAETAKKVSKLKAEM